MPPQTEIQKIVWKVQFMNYLYNELVKTETVFLLVVAKSKFMKIPKPGKEH